MTELIRLQAVYEDLIDYLNSKGISLDHNANRAPLNFELNKTELSALKIACIMDEFTYFSYQPECNLLQLSIDNWQAEMEEFAPDMLFLESAWQGKEGGWHRKVAHGSEELYALTRYSRSKGIPIVYWGKEDPVYTYAFIPAASLADVIFTTDIDSIPKYKAETGNNHVYHLHFAAQPKVHNPIEKFDRKDSFCFAGAYYHKYTQRLKVFDSFAEYFISSRGFDIYDRNFGNARPEHAFPKHYEPHILGRLEPEEIDKAYKGYIFGVNMNSITQSSTMFARRLFELMASNTVVVGNFAHGVKNYFGDLTICTDSQLSLKKAMETYCESTLDKYRLKALRKVLLFHLYQDRLAYIVEKVFNVNIKPMLPKIAVFSDTTAPEQKESIKQTFNSQTYENKFLIFTDENTEIPTDTDYLAYFSHEDSYGENYLLDLALATRFTDTDGICKPTDKPYTYVSSLSPRSGIVKTNLITNFSTEKITGTFFATDTLNYAKNNDFYETDNDLTIINEGVPLAEIEAATEAIPMPYIGRSLLKLSAKDTAKLFTESAKNRGLTAKLQNDSLEIDASKIKNSNEYIYFPEFYPLHKLCTAKEFNCSFDAIFNKTMGLVLIFHDKNKNKLGTKFIPPGQSVSMPLSDESLQGVSFVRIALRFAGTETSTFKSASFGKPTVQGSSTFLTNSDVLILSNIYPSDENLYRNMFVHARVKAYQQKGFNFNVMCSNIYATDTYREFDGVHVIDGRSQMLAEIMSSKKIKTVCVHFLDEQMFTVLKPHFDKIRLIVWVHGAEIQPWWRRDYNYTTETERTREKELSEKRMAFWKEVFAASNTHDIKFVFVSQYFANEVMEDNKITIPREKFEIIHNAINTETFNYIEKPPEQRKRIFSCRPWATRKYANDLSVNAILELSKRKEFNDMYFHISGTGELFNELTKPLRKFSNVNLEERHYTHDEIAALHKDFGICLIPSRMDSQGVSRDEAMSSGLVPITSAVTAIPEFVDENSGILAPEDDWQALADGILKLYNDPDLFLRLSKNAAERVRKQSSAEIVIEKELCLITGEY